MKAIKHSIWYEQMIDAFKHAIIMSWNDISKNNGVNHSPDQRKEFERNVDWWFTTLEFDLYVKNHIENIISKMVDEQIDLKAESIDLWKQIAINTSKNHVPWQMMVDNADHVVNVFQRKFTNQSIEP